MRKMRRPITSLSETSAHAVIVVVQVEMAFAAEDPRHLGVVALVAEHVLADGARRAQAHGVAHIVVGRADEISRVSFFDQLGDRARRGERDVIGVRLDRQQHLAAVRLARHGTLQNRPGRRLAPELAVERVPTGRSRRRPSR